MIDAVAATQTRLEIDAITSLAALRALESEWWPLWWRSVATPFQSPQWLIPWWEHFGQGELRTLVLRRNRRLVAVVPLYSAVDPVTRRRKFLFVGTGNTDYLDGVFDPMFAADAAQTIFDDWLEAANSSTSGEDWDDCQFLSLPRHSPLLTPRVPSEWHDEAEPQAVCPVLTLPRRIEQLSEVIPAARLKELHYCRRRLERIGMERVESVTERNFEELFAALLRLHRLRWEAADLPGVLHDPAVRRFHQQAARELLRAGLLRLYGLRLHGRLVAAFYGFADSRRTYYYLSGFEPDLARLSLGTVIVGHAIEQAVRDGCEAFDFLQGQEPYKSAWGAADQPVFRRCLRRRRGSGG